MGREPECSIPPFSASFALTILTFARDAGSSAPSTCLSAQPQFRSKPPCQYLARVVNPSRRYSPICPRSSLPPPQKQNREQVGTRSLFQPSYSICRRSSPRCMRPEWKSRAFLNNPRRHDCSGRRRQELDNADVIGDEPSKLRKSSDCGVDALQCASTHFIVKAAVRIE